ncbi:hypothetical protein DL93DRAFT_2052449 [Clavulina sp. PMI_390]|nr:hypothetical protein DL93DRAFT_2052449 [Clavulina sp. PMI_390]
MSSRSSPTVYRQNFKPPDDFIDNDSDDDDIESLRGLLSPPSNNGRADANYAANKDGRLSWLAFMRVPQLTTFQRDIVKCAIAYLIGSLFTFNPYLSKLVSDIVPSHASEGPSPTGHMVATVTVYFNPAKSLGAMQEADIYCLVAALFSAFIALLSMDTFWFFVDFEDDLEWAGDLLTFFLIASAVSAIVWVKGWINKPSFGPAASMASIIIFVTVVKEGGLHVLLQVAFTVFIGVTISNLICALIWVRPQRSRSDFVNSLNSFAVLLSMLTRTFLLEEDLHPNHAKLLRAVKDHEATFTSLKRSHGEAKSEWWNANIQASEEAYEAAIGNMTRLAQHVGGLRSGLNLQKELAVRTGISKSASGNNTTIIMGESVIVDALEKSFGEFVDELAPPMRALASTIVRTLKVLRNASASLGGSSKYSRFEDFDAQELIANIRRALFTFDSTSNYALARMFHREEAEIRGHNDIDPQEAIDDGSETLCLVYFFIFNLQEFATELIGLVEVMSLIQESKRATSSRWARVRSWLGLRMAPRPIQGGRPGLKRRICEQLQLHQVLEKLFPPVKPHAPNTVNRPPPQSLSFWDRQKQHIWDIGHRLREPDTLFAIKTGLATAMLALPAFMDSTRDFFVTYRGEWALISFVVVSSKTIGATNQLAVQRIVGTFAAITSIFPHQPYALAIFGFLFSIPCFYVIVGQPQNSVAGRFVLLAYNLTCLFRYNMRAQDQSVWTIALYRSMAVTLGVVWALVVARWWWPSEARRELTRGLSELCLNMSWLYTSLVRTWPSKHALIPNLEGDAQGGLVSPPNPGASVSSPCSTLALNLYVRELHLQLQLLHLQKLVAQAALEFRLKGPFPVTLYRGILTSLQTILDNLHSIRCVSMRDEWYVSANRNVQEDVLRSVQWERRAMIGNVLLFFSTLSAAFGLKAPLSPFLPPAEEARQRLVEAIRRYSAIQQPDQVRGSHSRQLLYIAYVLMMSIVVSELNFLGSTAQTAFGVIGDGLFEDMFEPQER